MNNLQMLKWSFLAAVLTAGCADRNDVLQEWDPSFSSKCSALSQKTTLNFDQKGNMGAVDRTKNLTHYWSTMTHGKKYVSELSKNDTVLCFGTSEQQVSPVDWNKNARAYLVDALLDNEDVARRMIWDYAYPQYRKSAPWSEKLIPEDAILLSRIQKAHEVNVRIAESYFMAGKNFETSMWRAVERDEDIGRYASVFRSEVEANYDARKGYRLVLFKVLDNPNIYTKDDKDFLNWYNEFLHDHNEVAPSVCLDFEGHLDPCVTTETVPPAKTTAASKLVADDLVKLSGVWMPDESYLTTSDAQDILRSQELRSVSADNAHLYKKVLENAEKCCGENRKNSDSFGHLGLGLGRGRLGISLF